MSNTSQTKLVVLRGPSSAGKSTVAKELFAQAGEGTVLIGQDYYRFIFKPPGGLVNSKAIHEMILQNTLTALRQGYDVILEGILNVKSYSDVVEALVRQHSKNNHFFYFDVSLKETLRRHRESDAAELWTEDNMRDWYHANDTFGYDFEHIIPESSSTEQTVATIKRLTRI